MTRVVIPGCLVKRIDATEEYIEMNSAVLYIAISLDGFIAGPNDDISWLFRYNDVDYGFNEFFSGIGAMIQGRRAYEIEVKNGWETPTPVPTFVLSHHLPELKSDRSNIIFTDEDISEVLKKAKQLTGKDVWIEGGANVVQQFLDRDLIDVIVLSIVPVILGDGIRLFGKAHKTIEFTVREVRRFDKGLVQIKYARGCEAGHLGDIPIVALFKSRQYEDCKASIETTSQASPGPPWQGGEFPRPPSPCPLPEGRGCELREEQGSGAEQDEEAAGDR